MQGPQIISHAVNHNNVRRPQKRANQKQKLANAKGKSVANAIAKQKQANYGKGRTNPNCNLRPLAKEKQAANRHKHGIQSRNKSCHTCTFSIRNANLLQCRCAKQDATRNHRSHNRTATFPGRHASALKKERNG